MKKDFFTILLFSGSIIFAQSFSYTAKISNQDHYNSSGNKITKAEYIIQQDRANYHKFHKRDSQDEDDNYFYKKENRFKIYKMIQNAGGLSSSIKNKILNGNPIIKVTVKDDKLYVNLAGNQSGNQTQKRKTNYKNSITRVDMFKFISNYEKAKSSLNADKFISLFDSKPNFYGENITKDKIRGFFEKTKTQKQKLKFCYLLKNNQIVCQSILLKDNNSDSISKEYIIFKLVKKNNKILIKSIDSIDKKFYDLYVSTALPIVKKTGQVKSYGKYDDGYYQKGATPSYTRDNKKGIVIDNITGLMWQDNKDVARVKKPWLTKENYKKCEKDYKNKACFDTSGDTAATYCKNLKLGGFSDWRLPTYKELLYIQNYKNYQISNNFKYKAKNYWTNNSHRRNVFGDSMNNYAYQIYYGYDYQSDMMKDDLGGVRCVRGNGKDKSSLVKNDTFLIKLDKKTNLIWFTDPMVNQDRTYKEAINFCEKLEVGGYKNWRVPNISEFLSITTYSQRDQRVTIYKSLGVEAKHTNYWVSTKGRKGKPKAFYLYDDVLDLIISPSKGRYISMKTSSICVHDNKLVLDGGKFIEKD